MGLVFSLFATASENATSKDPTPSAAAGKTYFDTFDIQNLWKNGGGQGDIPTDRFVADHYARTMEKPKDRNEKCLDTWADYQEASKKVKVNPVRADLLDLVNSEFAKLTKDIKKDDERKKTQDRLNRYASKILATFLTGQHTMPNQKYVTFIDGDQPPSRKRMYIINLETGAVEAHFSALGIGSSPGKKDQPATRFSNRDSTHASSVGCTIAAGVTEGLCKKKRVGRGRKRHVALVGCQPTLRMHGMEDTNSFTCARNIFLHSSWYMDVSSPRDVSWGCPAVRTPEFQDIVSKVAGGGRSYDDVEKDGGGGLLCTYREAPFDDASLAKKSGKRKYRRRRR